ncbi:MAG: SapC family protein [Rickettsiales bacterium]
MAKREKSAKAEAQATAQVNQAASELPLYFREPRLLDRVRHAAATILPAVDYRFTRDANSVPLNAIEFIEAVKSYPIVFSVGAEPVPVAVLGLEQRNLMVDGAGQWRTGDYVPAYARQYPFIFMEQAGDDKFYLCVDEAAVQYSEGPAEGGQPLYDAEGKPTELANHALQFCTQYYQHRRMTQNFCADLVAHALLSPYQTAFNAPSGRQLQLSGFQMIDEAAFNALPESVFNEFRSKGWLPFIYLALASTSNWKRLADLTPANAS